MVVKYQVPVGLSTGGKNTRPVPVSVRVGYGCHPRVKNHSHTCTRRVKYPAGTEYPYLNCHLYLCWWQWLPSPHPPARRAISACHRRLAREREGGRRQIGDGPHVGVITCRIALPLCQGRRPLPTVDLDVDERERGRENEIKGKRKRMRYVSEVEDKKGRKRERKRKKERK
jgi:hypothetical protein